MSPAFPEIKSASTRPAPPAMVQPGYGDLISLVHDGRLRRARRVRYRQGQRIALDRIDGQAESQGFQQQWRIAAQRHDIGIAGQFGGTVLDMHALDLAAGMMKG